MTSKQKTMISQLVAYAKDKDQDLSILSALVNLVDTVREKPNMFHGLQSEREVQIVQFILSHQS